MDRGRVWHSRLRALADDLQTIPITPHRAHVHKRLAYRERWSAKVRARPVRFRELDIGRFSGSNAYMQKNLEMFSPRLLNVFVKTFRSLLKPLSTCL